MSDTNPTPNPTDRTMVGYRPEVEEAEHKKTLEVIHENIDLQLQLIRANESVQVLEKDKARMDWLEDQMPSVKLLSQKAEVVLYAPWDSNVMCLRDAIDQRMTLTQTASMHEGEGTKTK